MPLTIRELAVFRAVMESGSVTAAAEILHVTQPAVSKTLQQIERTVGFPCFLRQHNRLVPTPEARALLPEVLKAVAAVESVRHFAADLRSLRGGRLSIASVPSIIQGLLPEAVVRFRQGRDVGFVLVSATNGEVAQLVAENRVDLGFVITPIDDGHSFSREVHPSELCCVVPPEHALASRSVVTPHDLRNVALIALGFDKPVGVMTRQAFESCGVPLSIALQVTQTNAALALVRAGAGVAILDGFALSGPAAAGVAVRPFEPRTPVICRMLWSRHMPLSRLAQAFVAELEEGFASGGR